MVLCMKEGGYIHHIVYLIRRLRHSAEIRQCKIYIED